MDDFWSPQYTAEAGLSVVCRLGTDRGLRPRLWLNEPVEFITAASEFTGGAGEYLIQPYLCTDSQGREMRSACTMSTPVMQAIERRLGYTELIR